MFNQAHSFSKPVLQGLSTQKSIAFQCIVTMLSVSGTTTIVTSIEIAMTLVMFNAIASTWTPKVCRIITFWPF